MITLPLNATDEAIFATLYGWLNHLARGENQGAFDITYHPAGDASTPRVLQEQIAFYGEQFNEVLQLPPANLDTKPEHHVQRVVRNAPPAKRLSGGRLIGSYESLVSARSDRDPRFLGEASLQLPFGGKWSEVFATFEMINREGRLALVLKSIYVH
jgi:hypothetical protein